MSSNPLAVYAKAIYSGLGSGLAVLYVALSDGHIDGQEWVAIAAAVIAVPVGVGTITNRPNAKKLAPHEQALIRVATRLDNVEAQLPTIPSIADAVTAGVLAAQPAPPFQLEPRPKPRPAPEEPHLYGAGARP